MRFANHDDRLVFLGEDGFGVDVERASGGVLPSNPLRAFERWTEVLEWAASNPDRGEVEIDLALLGPPSPSARTAFGVAFNHAGGIGKAGTEPPEFPTIFAKLFASLAGPFERVPISTGTVDWEVEVAVVIGRRARRVTADQAWDHVAGLTVAQDLSDRGIQGRPHDHPQFTLGKSLPGFCPTGPYLVTPDEFEDPDDLELRCAVNGEEVQHGRTSEFVFSVPQLIEYLSGVTELLPGDLILTGTPAGVGATMDPPRFLSPGDVLEGEITGLGLIRQEFVEDPAAG